MYRPNTLMRAAVVAAAGSLVLAGCGGSDGDSGNSGTKKSSGVQLYFVDGNTADYSGDFDKGTLNGVRATFPGAELGDEFKQRLLKTNPKLKDFTYGPESYDATVVVALAAIAAKNDSGKAIGEKMAEVTDGRREVHHVQGLRCRAQGRQGHRLRRCLRPDRPELDGFPVGSDDRHLPVRRRQQLHQPGLRHGQDPRRLLGQGQPEGQRQRRQG